MKELQYLNKSYSYQEYRGLIQELLSEGKSTGPVQNEDFYEFSKLNEVRMKRLDKTIRLNDRLVTMLQSVEGQVAWLVITEGWCGDAAQNIPVLYAMSEVSPNIELRLVLRDENLELMDQYLTNGGRSIPKLIAIDKVREKVLGTWGPRPDPAQEMVVEFKKKNPNAPYSELSEQIHLWYARDKTQTIQAEFEELISRWHLIAETAP